MGSNSTASRILEKIARALGRVPVGHGELILLGLSGGPDSVALLLALLALQERFGYRLAAAHFNHRLRAQESDRDEAFVYDLCAELGVQLLLECAEGLSPAMPNLEERARRLRHAFLARTAQRLGASHIALAHHAGDQAETVLMRLLRGTGLAGLGAMDEVGPGRLIRPLLKLDRDEVFAYLEAVGGRYVTDSSNLSCAITRNRLRNRLIGMIESDYVPGVGRRLTELAAEMRSVDDLLTTMAEQELQAALSPEGALKLGDFAGLHPALAAAVLRAFVQMRIGDLRRIGRAHIEAMRRLCLEGPPNGRVDLPGGWRVQRQYATLWLHGASPGVAPRFAVRLTLEGPTVVEESGTVFMARIVRPEDASMPASSCEAVFDADKVGGGLVARNFIPGDRLRPLGLGGSRKVKDVFIDRKLPRARRSVFPIVTLDNDEIVWLPGLARGCGAIVTGATRRMLHVAAQQIENRGESAVA